MANHPIFSNKFHTKSAANTRPVMTTPFSISGSFSVSRRKQESLVIRARTRARGLLLADRTLILNVRCGGDNKKLQLLQNQ